MPEEYDEITRAIEVAKAKVDRSYTKVPTKTDLVASYGLTESEIDGLREKLNERLSRAGREVLKLDNVYLEHLHRALRAPGQPPIVRDDQWRERLVTDMRDQIEQGEGPANMLANEVAKQGPREFLGALLDCLEEVSEPVQPGGEPEMSARTPPAGAVQPSETASSSTPPPDARPTMPEKCEAPGDRMRTDEELGSITAKIHFPYGAKTITATDDSTATNPKHLEGEAAVAHLLRVNMRGELETGIQEEARKALGIEDVRVELLAVNERQSVELVLAVIGLAATLVKDAPEIMKGFDRLFQGSLNIVRRVLQRMPRPGPVPAHVLTGFWTPGAALERMQREPTAQPAPPETGRIPPRVEPPAQPDTDRIAPSRLPMPSLLLSIYLLIVNVALIATLIVLVFWQR